MAAVFLLSIHTTDGYAVVSVCDSELLGRRFEEDNKVLDIKRPFFGGKEATVAEIVDAIRRAKTVNIVGNAIIGALLKENILKESGVREIQNIQYAHIYKL